MEKENLFQYVCWYVNAKYTTNEFSLGKDDWEEFTIHGFDVTGKLILVLNKRGSIVSTDILNSDGFLLLKRFKDITDEDAMYITSAFMNWTTPYIYFKAREKDRIIMGISMSEHIEFNIGLNDNNGKFWCRDIETHENKEVENIASGISMLTSLNYGFDWMFDDDLNRIAVVQAETNLVK